LRAAVNDVAHKNDVRRFRQLLKKALKAFQTPLQIADGKKFSGHKPMYARNEKVPSF